MGRVYFSADIETNGLIAGLNSMISLGCAAINMDTGVIASTFKANVLPVEGLYADESTMTWWKGFPEAYKRATENAMHADVAMAKFYEWVQSFRIERPVLAAWKPGFDVAFIRYYAVRFHGKDLFGRAGSGLDIKTLTAAALGWRFTDTQIASVPVEMKNGFTNHTHDALEDAMEQAYVLYNAEKKLGITI